MNSVLIITRDIELRSDIYMLLQHHNCLVNCEEQIMRALLYVLENRPILIIADLKMDQESIIPMIDVLKKSGVHTPLIAVYGDESNHLLSEVCERGILYRFRKPLDGESVTQLEQIVDRFVEKADKSEVKCPGFSPAP